MRLVLLDLPNESRFQFDPIALSRPVFELRCGMTTLAAKLVARTGARDVACFIPAHIAEAYAEQWDGPVNQPSSLTGDDLLLVDGRVRADSFDVEPAGAAEAMFADDGTCLYARIPRAELAKLDTDSIEGLLQSARRSLPASTRDRPATWKYGWDLILANSETLIADFAAAGRCGIEGTVERPFAIRGSEQDIYIAAGAVVHPMAVIDATQGPVYIETGAQIHPFTRIEGPCYIGRESVLYRTNCRAGNSIGPVCRVGGEIEESIIHGHSNKYHEGFLGHAYVGQWVNLGAQTTNSDLRNDYSNVSVALDGRHPIDTGSPKVGSLIGDHTRTSIGTLLNTGAYVGAMTLIAATGKLLPRFIPSFAWFVDGRVSDGFGRTRLYSAAKTAMRRRGHQWTDAQHAMWEEIYELTAGPRNHAIKKGRRTN
jgi:UDP-N-acetylglucosamine diphosphorylase/glucosamine-1-phosphate N-acetyltransferase